MTGMEALKVQGLSITFGGVNALLDVTFSVNVGEKLAIIGPNGAGKTTLLNVLNGQLSPTAGRIQLFRQDVTTLPTHRRAHLGQARSFQITSLFPNLTLLNNALLAFHGTRPSRFQMARSVNAYRDAFSHAEKLLGSIGLWEKRNEVVNAISYGDQRKVEIALALASEPKLLLLDEPSAGLTSGESADIADMIRNLEAGITVLVVDHDMDLVFGVAERIIVLHYGQIIAEGTCEEIQADARVRDIYMGDEEGSWKCWS